ncbi:MAG: addiction module antitoxin [Oscillatoriales cyanobacterium CG2_30_40_61]|nr:MAG: addiction module antitoxin [Oscillatoriales cyanobacterium CG2_30_40_61]
MTPLQISLPESLQQFIDQQVREGSYNNTDEYIYHLILEDQKRNAKQQLEEMLIAGLDSGDPIEITDDWWENKRAELIQNLPQS